MPSSGGGHDNKTHKNGNHRPQAVTRHILERLSAYRARALPPDGRGDVSSTADVRRDFWTSPAISHAAEHHPIGPRLRPRWVSTRLTRGEYNEARLAKREGTSVERCLRNALKAGAPVGCTSAQAEVAGSGAGRLCDEESFVGSATPRVYKGAIRGSQYGNPG